MFQSNNNKTRPSKLHTKQQHKSFKICPEKIRRINEITTAQRLNKFKQEKIVINMENLNKIILGDCITELKKIPDNSIDLIFAAPL